MKESKEKKELLALMNVGKKTLEDFEKLGIFSLEDLAKSEPEELFSRLQKLTGKKHDPCVLDVFCSAVNEARTGERKPWWYWSRLRKKF